jgi:anti-anti-sigma regulatory factor
MRLANDSPRGMQAVFDEFADPVEFTFDKTVVPLRLAQHEGEKLVSRSQAKRVAHRFEKFKHVVLDFEGVTQIGQAFADELFRVFALEHPQVRLTPVNPSPAVGQMISRVLSSRGSSD